MVLDSLSTLQARNNRRLFVMEFLGDNAQDRLPDDLVGLVTKHAFGGRIPTGDHAIEVLGNDGIVGALHDGSQPESSILEASPVRGITRNFRSTNHTPHRVANGRHAERDLQAFARLVEALGFVMVHALARTNFFQDHRLFMLQVRRDDGKDRSPDDFVGGKAEKPLRGRIPIGHNAIQVFRDDGIVRGFNDGCQAGQSCLLAAPFVRGTTNHGSADHLVRSVENGRH